MQRTVYSLLCFSLFSFEESVPRRFCFSGMFSVFFPCHVLDHWLLLSSHQEEWHSKQNTAECLPCPDVYKLCPEVHVSMFTVSYSTLLTSIQPVVCDAFWICFNTRHHSSTSVHLVIPVCLHYLVHFQWLWIAAFTLDSVWMLVFSQPFPASIISVSYQADAA